MQRTTKKTMDESDAKSSASFSASAASAALGGLRGSVSAKWNSSGASDAVAKINANLPQGTKDLLGSASAKIQFRREHFRGVGIFFGLGEDKPFYLEKNPALLMPRLKHNVSFFYLNYAVLTCILFLLTVLVSPSALIGMALLAFSWMSVIKSTETGEMKIKGKFMIGWLGGLVGGWRVGTNKQLAIREGESNVRTRVRQVVRFPVTNCIWSVFGETPLLELFHSARQYIVICRGRYGYPEVVLVVRSSGAESRKGRKLNGRTGRSASQSTLFRDVGSGPAIGFRSYSSGLAYTEELAGAAGRHLLQLGRFGPIRQMRTGQLVLVGGRDWYSSMVF